MDIPSGSAIVDEFDDVIHRWHDLDPGLDWEAVEQRFAADRTGCTGQIRQLAVINCFQWHLEEECRARYDDLRRLGLLKRAIDASNQRRVLRIDEIDRRICERLATSPAPGGAAPVCLLTPGSLLDRLSVLQLKRHHTREDGAERLLTEQIDDLAQGIQGLMQDLVAGRQRLKFYRTQKLYGAHG